MEAKICLIGKGNVGHTFLQLLHEKQREFKEKYKLQYKVNAIFEYDGAIINENGVDLYELLKLGNKYRESSDWREGVRTLDFISNLDVNILVESTPTNPKTGEPGLSHILESLNNGIDVITSNKGPFYLEYSKIKNLAKKKSCIIKYEATVASCVPIISIKEKLMGNTIIRITSILNGTCNFILDRMMAEKIHFSLALKEAQELGYAEADPSLDIEGYDAAGKLVILANELLGMSKTIHDVKIRGISKVTPHAIELAKSEGFVIKHLAIAEKNDLIVEPRLIERDSPLNIRGTLNVIELFTKYAGPIILTGRGAGGFEAASAMLNDLINISMERGFIKEI
ncbi:MAG: homoserine dehydrogenase [Promethearchaeota archaeon]